MWGFDRLCCAALFVTLGMGVSYSAARADEVCDRLNELVAAAGDGFQAFRGAETDDGIYTSTLTLPGVEDPEDCYIFDLDTSWSFHCKWRIKGEERDRQLRAFVQSTDRCYPFAKTRISDEGRRGHFRVGYDEDETVILIKRDTTQSGIDLGINR